MRVLSIISGVLLFIMAILFFFIFIICYCLQRWFKLLLIKAPLAITKYLTTGVIFLIFGTGAASVMLGAKSYNFFEGIEKNIYKG